VKRLNYPLQGKFTNLEGPDGTKLHCYGSVTLQVRITDSTGIVRTSFTQFQAIDMPESEILLGYPWLEKTDPQIDWAARRWRYRVVPSNLELIDADTFQKAVADGARAFAACISAVDGETTGETFVGEDFLLENGWEITSPTQHMPREGKEPAGSQYEARILTFGVHAI